MLSFYWIYLYYTTWRILTYLHQFISAVSSTRPLLQVLWTRSSYICISPSATSVGIECSSQADILVIEVRPHQPVALPTSLAEGPWAHHSSGVQMPTWSGAIIPAWWTTSTSRHWIHTTIMFCLVNDSGCSMYSSVHCRWQSISCCSRSSM